MLVEVKDSNLVQCGFLWVEHERCNPAQDFVKEFERVYEDAENGIFKLEEWHDSYVFGSILNSMKDYYPEVLDYSAPKCISKTAKTGGGGHPIVS